jgi:tryptophanyl-tRNA synthetase
MSKGVVFSGIQPTGELHIGNYLGAIRNWIGLQDEYTCYYCIVDYHALTADFDPNTLSRNVINLAMDLVACGIDPSKSVFFAQSQVPEHTELAWILSCFTSYGDLTRMTQFKEKTKDAEFINAGLFSYPILQAADILLYRARWVPVGDDQLQHLELARRIARKFNNKAGKEFFPEVKPILSKDSRIMSLADPTQKMSKSLGPAHFIGLNESDETVWSKVKSAVTDVGLEPGMNMSPGVENLFAILRGSEDPSVIEAFEEKHKKGTLLYKDLKEAAFESLKALLSPVRIKRSELCEGDVIEELRRGRKQASTMAEETIRVVRELLGVPRFDS